ncbi:MAG: sel1 repeat family protein [Ignavibacteriae bacterium]|nr:sel1 repeat family protein [Ignavibacteriota bacterium]
MSQDFEKAFFWYKKSAEQGYPAAQYNLAETYILGEGTSIDMKQTAFWMRKASENGFEQAKENWEELELWKYE